MDFFRSSWQWATGQSTPDREVKPPEKLPAEGSFGSTLWTALSNKLGSDVFRAGISLPSWMYEPLSILQRQAEMIEHSAILDEAAKFDDSIEQLAYVCAFAVSGYSNTQRFRPNFNPLLGETFEYIDKRNNARFFAEQVSHHPPISAFHSENEKVWTFWQNSSPTTKFLGNSMDVDTHGNSHICFHNTKNHFFYTNPCTRVNNLIIGSISMEHYGELKIRNINSSETCLVIFKQSGYFQGTQYGVEGYIYDSNGNKCVKLEGRWDSFLTGTWLVTTSSVKEGETKSLWKLLPEPVVNPKYGLKSYSASLNEYDTMMYKLLPPTDSRRRLDRLFLEKGDTDSASHWKREMEELQRQDRKNRTLNWKPVWFKESDESDNNNKLWVYCGDYWEQRAQKEILLKENNDGWLELLYPKEIEGLACDFLKYSLKPIPITDNNLKEVNQTSTTPSTELLSQTTTTTNSNSTSSSTNDGCDKDS